MTKILIEIDTDTQRVVPVEPTVKMLCAGRDTPCEATGDDAVDAPEDYRRVYRTMIAAAPQPEPVDADLRRDAERYRWLRKALSDRSMNGRSHHFCSISEGHPEELNKEIDAAMAQGEQK